MCPSDRMKRKPAFVIIAALLVVLSTMWAPWMTKEDATNTVVDRFAAEWRGVMDGCGLNCNGCGAKESHKTLFGVSVTIEYACGMLPSDSPEFHRTETVLLSFLGTVHGMPKP